MTELQHIFKIVLMLNRTAHIIFISIFLLLAGCSTVTQFTKHNTDRHYSQAVNLPADYPTKYLPDGNIWDEIGSNLKFSDNTNLPRVKEQIRWFQQHQDFLNRTIERGAPFIYYIYQETKRRHLPAELVLIPIFESGYSACSRSYANAVGFWQFNSITAKTFHLKINRWYDGRCDPVVSTDNALKYFTYLHSFFDNDWFLAISAYNAGPGRIQKAILSNQRRGQSTNFWDLGVTEQTLSYVPKLLALAAIIKNPEHYGVQLLSINNGPYFEQVEINSQIDLRKTAKLAEVDLDTIKRLNPGLKRGVTAPDGPHTLLIPKNKVAIFKANLNGTPRPVETEIVSSKSDETPIATTPQYRTTSKNKIKAAPTTTKATQTARSADNVIITTGTIPYKTANGDTVLRVAKHFRTTPEKIRAANHLTGNTIKVGQILQIPHTTKTSINTATPKSKSLATKKAQPKPKVSIKRNPQKVKVVAKNKPSAKKSKPPVKKKNAKPMRAYIHK